MFFNRDIKNSIVMQKIREFLAHLNWTCEQSTCVKKDTSNINLEVADRIAIDFLHRYSVNQLKTNVQQERVNYG